MAHEITKSDVVGITTRESDFWTAGGKGWHGFGESLTDHNMSAVQAGSDLGLFYRVNQAPVYWKDAQGKFHEVASHVMNFREDNGAEMGIVGSGFTIAQNQEVCEFSDALAQTGKVSVETIGTVQGGKKFWICCRADAIELDHGDEIIPFIVVSNAHDGSAAIHVTPTSVRPVCANTLNMVVPRGQGHELGKSAIAIRHTGKISDKLNAAKQALREYSEVQKRNAELIHAMQQTPVSRQQSLELFARTYAREWTVTTDKELASADLKTKKKAERRADRQRQAAEDFLKRYDQEREVGNLYTGNAWATFNAVSGYIQHDKAARMRGTRQKTAKDFQSQLFGERSKATDRAFQDAYALTA